MPSMDRTVCWRPYVRRLVWLGLASIILQVGFAFAAIAIATPRRHKFIEASDGSLAISFRWNMTIIAEISSQLSESGWSRTENITTNVGFPTRWLTLSGARTTQGTFPSSSLPPGPLYRQKNYLLSSFKSARVDFLLFSAGIFAYCTCLIGLSFVVNLVRSDWLLRRGRCPRCGYDCSEIADCTCPECGLCINIVCKTDLG